MFIPFQVSSLVVESCDDLILNLDLRGLNLSSVSTVIRDSKIVMLETILADYRESFAQTYNLSLYKVKNATLSGINLVSSVMVSVKVGVIIIKRQGCTLYIIVLRDIPQSAGKKRLPVTLLLFLVN